MALNLTMFPIEESHGFVMRLAANRMRGGLNRAFAAAGLDFTAEQWKVLSALRANDGLSQTEVAQNVTKDRQTMTRILDLLQNAGLVERRPHPKDRRCNLVFITPLGMEVQQRLLVTAQAFTEAAFEGLTQAELDMLMRLCRRVVRNVDEMNPERLQAPEKPSQE